MWKAHNIIKIYIFYYISHMVIIVMLMKVNKVLKNYEIAIH